MSTTRETLIGINDTALALPATTNAPASLAEAGADFASLMVGVGSAVSATQQKLTAVSADATSALATTLVDVIAVQETVYDDEGTLAPGTQPIMAKLPVITFVSPVYYEYPVVRLQGRFRVDEFVADTKTSVDTSVSGSAFGVGMSLQKKAFSLGAAGGFSSNSSSTNTDVSSDAASASGQMRMFARLQPRDDVGIPKPLRVISGPRISIAMLDLRDDTSDPNFALVRKLSVRLNLQKADGTPIEGKLLSIEAEGIAWNYVPEDQKLTDATGNVEIELTRTVAKAGEGDPAPDTSAKPVVVAAFLGMVSNRTRVMI